MAEQEATYKISIMPRKIADQKWLLVHKAQMVFPKQNKLRSKNRKDIFQMAANT